MSSYQVCSKEDWPRYHQDPSTTSGNVDNESNRVLMSCLGFLVQKEDETDTRVIELFVETPKLKSVGF